jgi:hypothetical protein
LQRDIATRESINDLINLDEIAKFEEKLETSREKNQKSGKSVVEYKW